ncbi:MAG: FG-GAP-like repeat-containing protein [Planctomycetota bacterium]
MGIGPQFADLDADGRLDLLTGCFEGYLWMARGTEDGFAAPTRMRDSSGAEFHTGMYWSDAESTWIEGGDHTMAVTPLDWDGDGDLDLVTGSTNGHFRVRENTGTRTEPAFATTTTQVLGTDGEPLEVPGGDAAPRFVDWDGDGTLDILTGSAFGGVHWFRGTGSGADRRFEAPRMLVADPGNKLPARLGQGTLIRTQADAADIDGDGDLDLFVGGAVQIEKEGGSIGFSGPIQLFARTEVGRYGDAAAK